MFPWSQLHDASHLLFSSQDHLSSRVDSTGPGDCTGVAMAMAAAQSRRMICARILWTW